MLDLHVYMPETFDRQIVIVGMDHVHVFVYRPAVDGDIGCGGRDDVVRIA